MEEEIICEARKRNLKISIVKGILSNGLELKRKFNKKELVDYFCFRQSDLFCYDMVFFDIEGENYFLKEKMQNWIQNVITRHTQAKAYLEEAQVFFEKNFGHFEDEYEKSNRFNFDFSILNEMYEKQLKSVIPIIHWGRLPILPEYLMINSGRIPEKGIEEFYDHYHMLQALRRDILGKGVTMDIKGDLTLGKRLTFKVYNRRWGHADIYGITRTVEGWNVSHITTGKSEKDGEGALIANLHHDSIFFPEEGVKYALSELWEQAEDGELTLSELQERLQQVADWISIVEKAVGEGQPDWVGYY